LERKPIICPDIDFRLFTYPPTSTSKNDIDGGVQTSPGKFGDVPNCSF